MSAEIVFQLPSLPTRKEIAEYCNAKWPDRPDEITEYKVRRWEREGWIHKHPAYQKPARYPAGQVLDFLEGRF